MRIACAYREMKPAPPSPFHSPIWRCQSHPNWATLRALATMEGIKISLFEPGCATGHSQSEQPSAHSAARPLPICPLVFGAFLIRSVSHQQLCFWFSVYRLHCLPASTPFPVSGRLLFILSNYCEKFNVKQLDRICKTLSFKRITNANFMCFILSN